jgi:hypothetical protein
VYRRRNVVTGVFASPGGTKKPRLTREEFAKISEVDGLRLSDAMRDAFEDFDRRKLTPEERRQAIIKHFKRPVKQSDSSDPIP